MNLGYLTADDTFGTSHHTYPTGGVGTENHILPVQTPPQIQRRAPSGAVPASHQQTSAHLMQSLTPLGSPWSAASPSVTQASHDPASPTTVYDRRDQVGLGELTTPRWMLSQAHTESGLPQRVLPLDSPIHSQSSEERTTRERNARAISYSLGQSKHEQATLMPSFASMQLQDIGVGVSSPSLESTEDPVVDEFTTHRTGLRSQPSSSANIHTPPSLPVRKPRVSQTVSAQNSCAKSSPFVQGMISDPHEDAHAQVSPLLTQHSQSGAHPDIFAETTLSTTSPTINKTQEFSRFEPQVDSGSWTVDANPSSPTRHIEPTQTKSLRQELSSKVQKSPKSRPRNESRADDHDETSSLAGRLSRRSLGAFSHLFKTSPRRSNQEDEDAASIDGPLTTSPSRSRLFFTRRRRQSLQNARNPMPRRPDATAQDRPEVSNIKAPAAPTIPPKSSRREGADVVHPLRSEPSPYYTAKAQGSRIPRSSSMVRILSRKSSEPDNARESKLPTSASMQSISSTKSSSFSTHNQTKSFMELPKEPSPVKFRSLRKSFASADAAEALRRHQASVTTATEPDISSKVTTNSETRTSTVYESNIPVPRDARRRVPNTQSRRAGRTLIDDTQAADEEMERHIQRVFRRKLAAGARHESLEKQLSFPQPEAPSKRLSPRQAAVIYGNQLCPYEQDEIHQYDSVYYVGSYARHKHYAVPEKNDRNYGYDDERGDYIVNLRDHLAYRYEIIKLLGRGSFGQVLQCLDHKTGNYVAIKLIRNKRRFYHQAMIEVKIMEHLTRLDSDNQHHVVHMTESFSFRNHLCVTMELLSINLYELIKANSFEGFSTTLIRRFTQQTLSCLALMRQARIVHCDLKPENILLANPRRSDVRVIDFGSSCYADQRVYTYIQSRFYRSPEVILGIDYHMAIDMWSLGCILAELYTGYPIFPGENENDQLACIMEVLGVPDRHLLEKSTRTKLFFDSTGAPRPVVSSRGQRGRPNSKSLATVLRTNDEWFLDFVARCLIWDPERRMKPDAALHHPWFLQNADVAIPRVPRASRVARPETSRDTSGSMLPRATSASIRP